MRDERERFRPNRDLGHAAPPDELPVERDVIDAALARRHERRRHARAELALARSADEVELEPPAPEQAEVHRILHVHQEVLAQEARSRERDVATRQDIHDAELYSVAYSRGAKPPWLTRSFGIEICRTVLRSGAQHEESNMARLVVEGLDLVVRLSRIEKVVALRGNIVVPLSAVEDTSVIDHPWGSRVLSELRIGISTTAPGQRLITLLVKAKLRTPGRAAVIVYGNRRSVVVTLSENDTPWRLIVVSCAMAEHVAADIARAAEKAT